MAVYLLCMKHPNGKRMHYLGYTARHPEQRLAEHKKGKQGSFTGRYVREGYVPELEYVWPDWGLKEEQRFKKLSRGNRAYQFRNVCSCGGGRPQDIRHDVIMNYKCYIPVKKKSSQADQRLVTRGTKAATM